MNNLLVCVFLQPQFSLSPDYSSYEEASSTLISNASPSCTNVLSQTQWPWIKLSTARLFAAVAFLRTTLSRLRHVACYWYIVVVSEVQLDLSFQSEHLQNGKWFKTSYWVIVVMVSTFRDRKITSKYMIHYSCNYGFLPTYGIKVCTREYFENVFASSYVSFNAFQKAFCGAWEMMCLQWSKFPFFFREFFQMYILLSDKDFFSGD